MNVFRLSAVASPLAGAMAGYVSVRTPGVMSVLMGTVTGLMIGVLLYLAAMALAGQMLRAARTGAKAGGLSPFGRAASLGAGLSLVASPFVSWAASAYVVSRLLHL